MIIKKDEIRSENLHSGKEAIDHFVNRSLSHLQKRLKANLAFWYAMAIIIGLINISIVAITVTILVLFFQYHANHPDRVNSFYATMGGSLILTILTLISFIFFFVIALYQTKNKREIYHRAYRNIQFQTIKYINSLGEYSRLDATNIYHRNVIKISSKALYGRRQKISFVKLIVTTFLGGANE